MPDDHADEIAGLVHGALRIAIIELVRGQVEGRPVQWADDPGSTWPRTRTSAGDFAGREWTIEVFDVARIDRRRLREALRDLFARVRARTGTLVSLVTHTPEDTSTHYAWVRPQARR